MKKTLSFFIGTSTLCFSYSDTTFQNTKKCWEFIEMEDVNKALYFLDTLIDDKYVENTDKVHYLILRSEIHILNMQTDLYRKDINELESLMDKYPECKTEKYIYYTLQD